MNNLATALRVQGKYAEAEQMHRQVLELKEQVLGAEHPDTLTSMNNLAMALVDQRKYSEAELIQVQAVRSSYAILGRLHPHTEIFVRTLMDIWASQGREAPEREMML